MNIFTKNEHIFGDYADVAYLLRDAEGFFILLRNLRSNLGEKAYLLDAYVRTILEVADKPFLGTAAEAGLMAFSQLQEILSAVAGGYEVEHPLFQEFRAFIHHNPLPHQERRTQDEIYTILLFNRFLEYAVKDYWETLRKEREQFDIVELRHLFAKLCAVLGGETEMEQLNQMLKRRFFMTLPMMGFVQGLTSNLIGAMISFDLESRRCCYELAGECNVSVEQED